MMTLARALKEKNRIVGEINSLKAIFTRENSRVEKNVTTQVSRVDLWDKILKRTDDLISLKAKIAAANVQIYPLIEKMSELKSRVTYIQTLNGTEGVQEVDAYTLQRNPSAVPNVISAHFNTDKKDELIADLQKEIGELQDRIDEFNATNKIAL